MLQPTITHCEFKAEDGKCLCQGRQNLVDATDKYPPVLTPVMALRNSNNDKFLIKTVPEWAIAPRNLPPYVMFYPNPTNNLFRAWVPDSFMSGAILSSVSTIEEVHLHFYPNLAINQVPLVPEALLFSVYLEAKAGNFSSEINKELATKFNILGFGDEGDYEWALAHRCRS